LFGARISKDSKGTRTFLNIIVRLVLNVAIQNSILSTLQRREYTCPKLFLVAIGTSTFQGK
jgi:hypothetical protein